MTWQWVSVLAVIAFWSVCAQALHSWKEVRMIQAMPEDTLREQVKT